MTTKFVLRPRKHLGARRRQLDGWKCGTAGEARTRNKAGLEDRCSIQLSYRGKYGTSGWTRTSVGTA